MTPTSADLPGVDAPAGRAQTLDAVLLALWNAREERDRARRYAVKLEQEIAEDNDWLLRHTALLAADVLEAAGATRAAVIVTDFALSVVDRLDPQ